MSWERDYAKFYTIMVAGFIRHMVLDQHDMLNPGMSVVAMM